MNWLKVKPDDNLQHILDNISQPTTIYLTNGFYKQKLVIKCDNVKLIGENRDKVVISNNDYAKKPHEDGREYNTFRTYTLCVVGENVILENLTVENSNTEPQKVGQCVALSVNSKSFLAKDVTLRSTQDTLFTSPFPDDLIIRYSGLTDDPTYYNGFIPREQLYLEGNAVQLFDNCDIYGTVDYVFGCAEAYFKKCNFISLAEVRGHGYVAAPAHSLKQSNGYAFVDCNFVGGGAKKGSVYLARPWRDFGKCQFVNCRLGEHISPLLFDKWNDTYRNNTARFEYFGLTDAAAASTTTATTGRIATPASTTPATVGTTTTAPTTPVESSVEMTTHVDKSVGLSAPVDKFVEMSALTPVEWSRQMQEAAAAEVIARCDQAFKNFKQCE